MSSSTSEYSYSYEPRQTKKVAHKVVTKQKELNVWQSLIVLFLCAAYLANASMMIYIGSEYSCDDLRPKMWLIIVGSYMIFLQLVIIVCSFQNINIEKESVLAGVCFSINFVLGYGAAIFGIIWYFDDAPCSDTITIYGKVVSLSMLCIFLVRDIVSCVYKCRVSRRINANV